MNESQNNKIYYKRDELEEVQTFKILGVKIMDARSPVKKTKAHNDYYCQAMQTN